MFYSKTVQYNKKLLSENRFYCQLSICYVYVYCVNLCLANQSKEFNLKSVPIQIIILTTFPCNWHVISFCYGFYIGIYILNVIPWIFFHRLLDLGINSLSSFLLYKPRKDKPKHARLEFIARFFHFLFHDFNHNELLI